jgi:hypothetical protein
MNLNVSVRFRNALAYFSLHREADGVFFAELAGYEGEPIDAPPATILLIRGVRRWTGSFDNPEVLDELGRAIEASVSANPLRSSAFDGA